MIDGIYDLRTIQKLQTLGVKHFCFDFRPKSFNFLQQHLFIKVISASYSKSDVYFLHFCSEKDFVVKAILNDLFAVLGKIPENVFLFFSDQILPEYVLTLDCPFYWKYAVESNIKQVVMNPLLKGITFDYLLLAEKLNQGQLNSFFNNIYQLLALNSQSAQFKFQIHSDWDIDIAPSVVDYFDFDSVSLSINHKVEICYRNVDLNITQNHLKHLMPV